MSNQYIPKEKLTAYERWEMAAFDEAERVAQAMAEAAAAPPPEPEIVEPPEPPAPVLTEEEIAAIREQAFAEGRASGFEAGFKDGLEAGERAGYGSGEARAKEEIAHLSALARSLGQAIENTESELAEDLLNLAIDIAAQVLRTALRVHPELLLPTVREAIATLANAHGHPNLVLHPDDAALVRERLGEQLGHTGWRIFEDPQIARGGCRVENGGAEVDASLATRWRRVIETLGQRADWLDSP